MNRRYDVIEGEPLEHFLRFADAARVTELADGMGELSAHLPMEVAESIGRAIHRRAGRLRAGDLAASRFGGAVRTEDQLDADAFMELLREMSSRLELGG